MDNLHKQPREPTYICIDLKSFYASVEYVYRGLHPLTAWLLVADETRSDNTIVLAVSPALKSLGVSSRPRLFEAKQAIRLAEAQLHRKIDFIIAPPRMAEYERVSAAIYEIYLKYVAVEDIHVYSIDEVFMDVTHYLHLYKKAAAQANMAPAHYMAITIIRDVLKNTGITATVTAECSLLAIATNILKLYYYTKYHIGYADTNRDENSLIYTHHRCRLGYFHSILILYSI